MEQHNAVLIKNKGTQSTKLLLRDLTDVVLCRGTYYKKLPPIGYDDQKGRFAYYMEATFVVASQE